MRILNQILAVTLLNLKNLPQRPGASVVAVVGVAAVVLVFAAVLSMARGFERTMLSAGADDTAIIMRSGATSVMSSGFSGDQVLVIASAPGLLKDGDTPVLSAELFVIVDVKKKSTNTDANVPFRGVQASAFDVRRDVKITEGRMFEAGRNEILVGRAAQSEFQGLDVGSTIRFGKTDWTVVGAFEAGGSVSESELWTDVRILQSAYRRGNSFQTVRVKLDSPESLEILESSLRDDPRIDPDVMTEREFYSDQSRQLTQFIKLVDKHYKSLWSMSDYSNVLGITPSHLNSICQKLVAKSALEIVHERLVLAARRELAYTERNIAGVAHHLGFTDPSYFTRFFKRETSMTPGEFRKRSGTLEA